MMHSPHYNLINIISLPKKTVGNIVENVSVSVKPVIPVIYHIRYMAFKMKFKISFMHGHNHQYDLCQHVLVYILITSHQCECSIKYHFLYIFHPSKYHKSFYKTKQNHKKCLILPILSFERIFTLLNTNTFVYITTKS